MTNGMKMKVNVDLSEGFDKLSTEEQAEIIMMCFNKLCSKAKELQELFVQLVKTYGVEMGIVDMSVLVQISSPVINDVPFSCTLGTKEGIKHALLTLTDRITKQVADIKKEASNDKE